MKNARSILWLCATIVVLTVLLIWFAKKPGEPTARSTADDAVTPESVAEKALPETTQQKAASANRPSQLITSAVHTNATVPTDKDKGTQMREGLSTLNDVPIVFDGKVEDQFGNPVAGAKVAASIRIYNGLQSTVERFEVFSDANGFFHIDHGKGEALGIMPSKEGYVLATANTRFVYSRLWPEAEQYNPDPNHPTVIKMWKLQGAEPLAGIDQRHKFPYTGTPVSFDLQAGKIVASGGDIKITVSRSEGVVSAQTLQDWSVKIEAVDGGLIRTDAAEARVTYALPASGYQPGDMFIMSTDVPYKWFGGVHQMYFVRSRGGQVYSKLNVGVAINRNPADPVWVEFRGAANVNGSRNFEADAPAPSATAAR